MFSLRSYNKWITGIAEADTRLITTLRRIRSGEFVYGKETGQAPLLQSLCEDLGLPRVWGDPAVTKRIPCEVCIRLLTAIPFSSPCMKPKFRILSCFCFLTNFSSTCRWFIMVSQRAASSTHVGDSGTHGKQHSPCTWGWISWFGCETVSVYTRPCELSAMQQSRRHS